jgi:RNA polymerase sigma-70 factor (ECF subfamily)
MPIDPSESTRAETSDIDLMGRLTAGDDLALNELMNRWSKPIAAFLYRQTGRYDVAMDLAQETFVKLYQARDAYRPSGTFSTYLFTIAVNLARNHVRWARRHPTVAMTSPSENEPETPEAHATGQTPDRAAISTEQLQAVHHAFQSLPDDLREAMILFISDDMSYAEIAAISGCSTKAVETRIYRARILLKERLKGIQS